MPAVRVLVSMSNPHLQAVVVDIVARLVDSRAAAFTLCCIPSICHIYTCFPITHVSRTCRCEKLGAVYYVMCRVPSQERVVSCRARRWLVTLQ